MHDYLNRLILALTMALALPAWAIAADVTITPAAGSGFVVKDAGNTADRLRVNENGAVWIPTLATGAQQATPVCSGAGGAVGPCAPGSIGTAGPPGPIGPAGPPGPAGSLVLPFTATQSDAATLFSITNGGTGGGISAFANGTGVAGHFEIANSTNTSHALEGTTNGEPGFTHDIAGVVGQANGTNTTGNGYGVFGTAKGPLGIGVGGSNSDSNGTGVSGRSGGTGVAGEGRVGVSGQTHTSGGFGVSAESSIASGGTALHAYGFSDKAALLEIFSDPGGLTVLAVQTDGNSDLALFKSGSPSAKVARIDSTGKGFFNGGTQTGGADVAELVSTTGATPQPGDVVEIDPADPDHFRLSVEANSTRVAGVISTKPGMTMNDAAGADRATAGPALALAGRVPVKVTNANGAIHIGDLLAASAVSGHAQRAAEFPSPGSVIGKALQNFDQADGSIQMLVWTH